MKRTILVMVMLVMLLGCQRSSDIKYTCMIAKTNENEKVTHSFLVDEEIVKLQELSAIYDLSQISIEEANETVAFFDGIFTEISRIDGVWVTYGLNEEKQYTISITIDYKELDYDKLALLRVLNIADFPRQDDGSILFKDVRDHLEGEGFVCE